MEKQEFKETAKKSIDEIFAKIDDLKEKQHQASDELKEIYREQIALLELKKEELQIKYADLHEAAEEKWDEVKQAFSESTDSFKEGFSKLKSIFK